MIINRISAGEVVESPFSIVKELIDNSLDAGATKISISIKNGGTSQIIVKDNGKGIEKDDIVKAFLPHATSKIKDIEDLNSISTLGFRGEALASISNVSQVQMQTKTQHADCGYQLEVNGGAFGEVTATSMETGTKIEVNNLFYNTPARLKFMKKPKQEETAITNIVSRYILAHPTIEFRYEADGEIVYQTKGTTLLDAICCVYNNDIAQDIMPIDKTMGNMHIFGYVSKVGYSKPNTTYQTLILNSRYVIDETVSKASYMAFEEYLMTRQFPFFVINLEMPPVDVDVNVHPSKLNVKFSAPSKVYDLVYTAIREQIFKQLNPETQIINKEFMGNNSAELPKREVKDVLIKTDLNSLKEIEIEPTPEQTTNPNIELRQTAFSPITMFDLHKETSVKTAENKPKTASSGFKNVEDFVDFKIIGELFNEFLVVEKEDVMLLIDFHAGHERLNYDKFTKMVQARDVIIQSLLVPYTQQMTPQEVDYILTLQNELSELGFEVDSFGDNKIIISSIPMQLKDINLKNFVDDLLHDMKNIKPTMNNEIRHYLMQKACKSSVKSGMKLSEMEIKELLKDLNLKNPVLLCPHGRPVITAVTRAQIEKWFKRIV